MPYCYTIVQSSAFRPRRASVSVTRYALRAYGGELGPSPYVRRRKSGANPVTLTTATSGSGCPQWLSDLAQHLQESQTPLGMAQILAQNARCK